VRASDVPHALAQQFYRRIAKGSSAARVGHVARILTESTALLVAQASAPDLSLLLNVDVEIHGVAEALPPTTTHILGTDSSAQPATVNSVLAVLPGASILHLSCHAQQDYSYPLHSAFLLANGKLTVSDLMKLKMPEQTYFAFLSSCQSAAGDPTLPDEAIHLAGTMLYVGFKSVVATLW
jgi:CHAT domain-containing protein